MTTRSWLYKIKDDRCELKSKNKRKDAFIREDFVRWLEWEQYCRLIDHIILYLKPWVIYINRNREIGNSTVYCTVWETGTNSCMNYICIKGRLHKAVSRTKKETLLGGLEPPTSWLTVRRASQLRHKSWSRALWLLYKRHSKNFTWLSRVYPVTYVSFFFCCSFSDIRALIPLYLQVVKNNYDCLRMQR